VADSCQSVLKSEQSCPENSDTRPALRTVFLLKARKNHLHLSRTTKYRMLVVVVVEVMESYDEEWKKMEARQQTI